MGAAQDTSVKNGKKSQFFIAFAFGYFYVMYLDLKTLVHYHHNNFRMRLTMDRAISILSLIVAILALATPILYRIQDAMKSYPKRPHIFKRNFSKFKIIDGDTLDGVDDFMSFIQSITEFEKFSINLVINIGKFIDVSEMSHSMTADSFSIWIPFEDSGDIKEPCLSSCSIYTFVVKSGDSPHCLYYSHGYWYLKGHFTLLPGGVGQGCTTIPLSAN